MATADPATNVNRAADDGGFDRPVTVILVVCAVMVIAGFLLKAQCMSPVAFQEGHQYSRLCYNDIQPLYGIRSIAEDVFPYVNGSYTDSGELVGGAIEYPVLTGLFLWFSGLFVEDGNSYLRVSSLLLAPFALVAAYLLARMAGPRALLWAASPALVYYSFHNWDLLVVVAVVAGIWSWHRGRSVLAAVFFGVGAALKMYPALFVLPLVLERWVAGRRGEAGRVLAAGAGTTLLINLPFMLINAPGWWATYAFHRARGPNYDSIWGLAQTRWGAAIIQMPTLNLLTAVLTLATILVVVIYGWERAKRDGVYPFLQVAAAILATFLLWNKVHSPQFTLWLLPFFVVLRVHVGWWIAYAIVDSVAYVGIFRWFYDITFLGRGTDTLAYNAMAWAVWGRAALLAVLVVVFLRAARAVDPVVPVTARSLSHTSTSVSRVGDPATT